MNNNDIPLHIVIIPDGNRRWAKSRGFSASYGHQKSGSAEHIRSLLEEAEKLGVRYLSFWGFSTENWKRSKREREAIFGVILKVLKVLRADAKKKNVRFRHIGRLDRLPKDIVKTIKDFEEETKTFNKLNVQLFLDYGGRDEIVRAVNKMIKNKISKIDEEKFGNYLDTSKIPDPDLIIRTSGEHRTSGFMPYQGAYSELYFVKKYFPDFSARDLRKAVEEFGKRKRNFGR